MEPHSFSEAIGRIVELSADLQIKRRSTSKYSLAFHDLSVAIAAYGKALVALVRLQQEKYSAKCDRLSSLKLPREAA